MTRSEITLPSKSTALDPEIREFLKQFSQMFSSIEHLSIPDQRKTIKEMFAVPKSQLEQVASVEDKTITGKNGPIHIRFFNPKNTGPLPIIVFFHRGGWVYGSVDESETICRRLANETGSIVAAVEYRLSPEHKFPVPLEDCYDATKWIIKNAASFKVPGNSHQVILCGESAGGNLAAAVTLMSRDKKEFSLVGQLLVYPVLTDDLNPKYYEESPDKSLLSLENMQFFVSAYLSTPSDGNHPYASPLKSNNFAHLPPTFIITAEYDALKHEGAQYGENLQKAGNKIKTKCYPKVIHGFLDLPLSESVKKEAIKDISAWTKSIIK